MVYTRETLNGKTVAELRQLCKNKTIVGMSKKRKDIIIDAILNKQKENNEAPRINNTVIKESEPVGDPNSINKASFEMNSSLTHPYKSFGDRATTTIRVSCGAASSQFPVIGKTVGAVKEFLREVLNIDKMAGGLVNGKQVEDYYILKTGDNLEFMKPAGRKG